jgi:hypothetical protein
MSVPDIMECGGKRSATPLCRKSRQVVRQNQQSPRGPKRRRRYALPAHCKAPESERRFEVVRTSPAR